MYLLDEIYDNLLCFAFKNSAGSHPVEYLYYIPVDGSGSRCGDISNISLPI